MNQPIKRLPGRIKGRSSGSIYGGLAWVAAVADDKAPTIRQQTTDILAKLERFLAAVGSDKTRIISATIHLANLDDKTTFDEMWAEWMGDDPDHWAQRTCMGADLVAGYLVEIKLLAAVNDAADAS